MIEASNFTCGCGSQFNGQARTIPPGWEFRGSALLCGDCIADTGTASLFAGKCGKVQDIDLATSILLRSGSYLDLSNPECRLVQPIDIASGLRQARFSAQTDAFYTVAQHSVLVLQLVEPVAREIGGVRGLALKRCALFHDAAEAFIHDITQPLKILLPEYRRTEAVLERALAKRFGVEWTQGRRDIVKRADLQALYIEKRDLIGVPEQWPALACVDAEKLAGVEVGRVWHPDEAQDRFLSAWTDLFPETERKAA